MLARQLPVLDQLDFVKVVPFENMPQGALGELPRRDAVFDRDLDLEVAVERVKMRPGMASVEHGDHDSQKAAQFWH